MKQLVDAITSATSRHTVVDDTYVLDTTTDERTSYPSADAAQHAAEALNADCALVAFHEARDRDAGILLALVKRAATIITADAGHPLPDTWLVDAEPFITTHDKASTCAAPPPSSTP